MFQLKIKAIKNTKNIDYTKKKKKFSYKYNK